MSGLTSASQTLASQTLASNRTASRRTRILAASASMLALIAVMIVRDILIRRWTGTPPSPPDTTQQSH